MTATSELMSQARSQLLVKYPFFGVLALRLRMVPANDLPCRTLATDGTRIFYDEGFVRSTPAKLLRSGIAHEVIHCALAHIHRRGLRDYDKWAYAIDFATNSLLKESGFELGDGWLYDERFKGKSAEEIYDLLPDGIGKGKGNGNGNGESGGFSGKPFDSHMAADESNPSNTANDWKDAIIQAASVAAGKTPASIQRMVDMWTKPQVDWREKLWRFATATAKHDISWMRPQRRSLVYGTILPGHHSEAMNLAVVVSDDSGSISDKVLSAMAAEINGIRASVRPQQTMHISCDAAINHEQMFEPDDDFVMTSMGGGGTDFRPPFERIEELGLKPDCLVYLTDGYGPFPDQEPQYPVLWCMTTDVVPPWGDYVRIEV